MAVSSQVVISKIVNEDIEFALCAFKSLTLEYTGLASSFLAQIESKNNCGTVQGAVHLLRGYKPRVTVANVALYPTWRHLNLLVWGGFLCLIKLGLWLVCSSE